MRFRELFYLLGARPRPRTYGYAVTSVELPADGTVAYARWLHPKERAVSFSQGAVDALREFLRPDDVAIDIGAHTGDSTLPIALAVGSGGHVLAVEPNPYVYPVLEKNASLNPGKTRITPLKFAATEKDGDVEMEYSDAGYCNGGMHEGISRWRHGHAFKLRVPGRNLERYLRETHAGELSRLRYIKIDAEGYDATIIRSVATLIAEHRPYLKAEVYKRTSREQRMGLYETLRNLDYHVFRVRGADDYRGDEITPDNVSRWPHYDIFCVPAEETARAGLTR